MSELQSLPGVIGVMPERIVQPNLNKAVSIANAPAAWAQASIAGQSNAGKGIKIAILDTGIDQTSPAFSDKGFTAPSGFPLCNVQSDCTSFTNNKVIVARSYVSMIAAGNCAAANQTGACTSAGTANPAVSLPDDYSARDRDGHGSAVAAAAAAVQNSGGTVAFSGMAPAAYLGNYKIYGSPGVSYGPPESVVIKALDDAVTDGMNVINFSSGTPAVAGAKDDVACGNAAGVPCDPLANAFELMAEKGVVITVAAGNYGTDGALDFYFNSITSPGTAPSVITVGATINSHTFGPSVSVNGSGVPSNLQGIAAALSDSDFYPSAVGANSGRLVDITTLGDNGQACSALPAGSLTDAYALVQQSSTSSSSCDFQTQATNVSTAGAIGIVFYMSTSSTTLTPPTNICLDNNFVPCALVGPAVMISQTDGQNVKAYIDAHPGTTVTIDTAGSEQAVTATQLVNTLAIYSSMGPAIDGSIKPDMVATGGFDPYATGLYDVSAQNGLYTVGESYDPNGDFFTTNGYIAADNATFYPYYTGTSFRPRW